MRFSIDSHLNFRFILCTYWFCKYENSSLCKKYILQQTLPLSKTVTIISIHPRSYCEEKVQKLYLLMYWHCVRYADNFKNCLGLAVDNDYKRNGIGSALLKQAEIWAKENGAVGIRLCSGAERVNAHKFYESQGYEVTKLQKNLKKIFNSFGG